MIKSQKKIHKQKGWLRQPSLLAEKAMKNEQVNEFNRANQRHK